MADLIFDTAKNQLLWPSLGKSWKARSGPWGAGQLPKGSYRIGRREITAYTASIKRSFQDKTNKGFFLPIYPTFTTSRGQDGRLGIHPDGGVSGTEGCIGLQEFDTSSFYDSVSKTAAGASLTLEVR